MHLMDDLSGKIIVDLKNLKKIEYVPMATRVGIMCCPECGWSKDCGRHAKDCWIGKALKEATGEQDTTDQEDSDKHTTSQ